MRSDERDSLPHYNPVLLDLNVFTITLGHFESPAWLFSIFITETACCRRDNSGLECFKADWTQLRMFENISALRAARTFCRCPPEPQYSGPWAAAALSTRHHHLLSRAVFSTDWHLLTHAAVKFRPFALRTRGAQPSRRQPKGFYSRLHPKHSTVELQERLYKPAVGWCLSSVTWQEALTECSQTAWGVLCQITS